MTRFGFSSAGSPPSALRLCAQEPAPTKPSTSAPADDPAFAQLELLTRAMEIIRQNYVDEKKVSYDQLIEGALEGMLRKLDPHCEYMGRSLFEEMQQEQRDTSEGVGITIALRSGVLTIITVEEDGPAAKAGVLPNDQLIRIGDVLTDSMSTMEAVQHLKGKAGEAVRITVRRPGTKQFLDFNLVRQALQESSVRDAMLLHEKMAAPWKVGYARITEFTQNTAKDLSDELDKLEKAGMQAFVLDLRNNPGGLITSAVDVCGEFLPPNTVVVTTEGRVASQNPPPYRTGPRAGRPLRKYPMTVLINQGSASGAELVAGALQDLKRAHRRGHPELRQGLGADHPAHEERRRHAPDHGEILHARPSHHPRERHRAEHRLRAHERGGGQGHAVARQQRDGRSPRAGPGETGRPAAWSAPRMC